MEETSMLNVRIPAELHKRFKMLAVQTGETMTQLTEEALLDLLKKRKGGKR